MANLTLDNLVEIIRVTISENKKRMDTISQNMPWEKWFQLELFWKMVSSGVQAQTEACMGDNNRNRYDYCVLNDDKSVLIGELKCYSANQPLDNVITGWVSDVHKLVNESVDYGKFAILIANINLIEGIDISEVHENVCNEISSEMDEDINIECKDASYGDYLIFVVWIE